MSTLFHSRVIDEYDSRVIDEYDSRVIDEYDSRVIDDIMWFPHFRLSWPSPLTYIQGIYFILYV